MAELEKGTPQVGLRFRNPDEAWKFWVEYGGRTGFDVRKRYTNASSYDGKVTSCRFVCSNEGHRRKEQTNNVRKCFRAETRTDCKARISLVVRGVENYDVTSVVLEHNDFLHLPETRHLMASQRYVLTLHSRNFYMMLSFIPKLIGCSFINRNERKMMVYNIQRKWRMMVAT